MRKPQVLIIDGDILFYRASCVAAGGADFGDVQVTWADEDEAFQSFDTQVAQIIGKKTFEKVLIAKSDDAHNFRKEMFPEYKANRKSLQKPELLNIVKQYAKDKYEVLERPRIEADDIVGIIGTDPSSKVLMQSGDKDLMQIPGYHLVNGKIVKVEEDEGELWFLTQTLTGDTIDNYKGCPGIGPKKAAAILDCEPAERWPRIVEAYEKAGLTEEDALLQARVARILRWGDYRVKDAKVRLWKPNVT